MSIKKRDELREGEKKILYAFMSEGELRFKDLLDKTGLSRPSLAENLKNLLKMGLVLKREGKRRIDTRYALTQSGFSYLEKQMAIEIAGSELESGISDLHQRFYELARRKGLHLMLKSRLNLFLSGLLAGIPSIRLTKDEKALLNIMASIIVGSVDLSGIPSVLHYDAIKAIWTLACKYKAYRFDYLSSFEKTEIPSSVAEKLIKNNKKDLERILGKELQDEEFLKIALYDFGKYLILPSNIYRQARRELLRNLL